MVKQNFVIKNAVGLHMRPAGVFAKGMAPFKSKVTINFENKSVNGKSVLAIMGASIKCGAEIELVCEGEDEDAAMKCAAEMIESGLGE